MLLRASLTGKSEKHFERNAITKVEWIGLIQFPHCTWALAWLWIKYCSDADGVAGTGA